MASIHIPTHSRSRWGVGDLLARRRKRESVCETWELIPCLPGWRKRTFPRSTSSTPSRPVKRFRGRRELDLVRSGWIVSDIPARGQPIFFSMESESILKRKLLILELKDIQGSNWVGKPGNVREKIVKWFGYSILD